VPHAVESKSKHSSAQHKSEHKEAKGGVPNANTSKCKQNPVRLRVQPTAMERAEALPLLGFRRRAPHACPASAAVQRVCREQRASKRWSALLTQTKSRIGHRCGMRKRLGEAHWAAFVRYAEAEHKAKFFRASGELRCEGKLDGTPCPNGARIDLWHVSSAECRAVLPGLHMDHMLVHHSFLLDDQHFLAVGLRLGQDLPLDLELDGHLTHLRGRVTELGKPVSQLERLVANRGALLLE